MPDDFAEIFDIENMGDDELKELVLQELHEYPEIDVDLIEVAVRHGTVNISGRVGTEQERQEVEHILTDVIGIRQVENELVIDELVRGQRSEAADEEAAEETTAIPQLAEGTLRTTDEAEHLVENIEAEQYGSDNMQQAAARGTVYEPPVRPTQEGTSSLEQH